MSEVFNTSSAFDRIKLGFWLSSCGVRVNQDSFVYNKRSSRPRSTTKDPLSGVNDGGGRLNFSMYGPSDLSLPDQSSTSSHGRREDYCPRNICPGCYVFDNGLGSPTTSTRPSG
jgi:hypothetical protein